jgi:hypothetical protein
MVDQRRWEWQSLAAEVADHKLPWTPEYDTSEKTYVVSPDSDTCVAIRGNTISVDRLDECRDGVCLWRRTVDAAFPLCQRDVRDVLRQFPVTPPTLYRPEYSPLAFVTDIATCTNGLRVAGVLSVRRRLPVDSCVLERAVVTVAGRTVQSVSVSASDPDAVRAVLRRFELDRLDPSNVVTLLKTVLGVRRVERIRDTMRNFSDERSISL